jgi:Fe-S-cluster containining protein
MLTPILAKSTCATCKFCCSFRRQSLWETPIFAAADLPKLRALYPSAKFRPAGASGTSFTFDISDAYHTQDPEEEALCPFLDPNRGCALPPELKPFDCKIWPLRAVRLSDHTGSNPHSQLKVALTPTCPAINKVPLEQVKQLAASGLGQQIIDYAEKNPDIIKEETPFLSNIVF